MKAGQFLNLVDNPGDVSAEQVQDLKEISEKFPYFTAARVLYLKSLQLSKGDSFQEELNRTVLYVADKKWLNYYLNPDNQLQPDTGTVRNEKFTGSYFDLLDVAEAPGGESSHKLKSIAEKLKAARLNKEDKQPEALPKTDEVIETVPETKVVQPEIVVVKPAIENPEPAEKEIIEVVPVAEETAEKEDLLVEVLDSAVQDTQKMEEEVKVLISKRSYREAIEILEQLNLINPKKSVYFADQIRFLKKVIENS